MGSLGSKVKKWVQIAHFSTFIFCFKNDPLLYWTSLLSKGNGGAQGSQGSTGSPGSPGSPGLMVYACYITVYYPRLTHSNISVNCVLFITLICSLCLCLQQREPLALRDWMEKMGNQGCGQVTHRHAHTQAYYPDTQWGHAIVGIVKYMHLTFDMWLWLFFPLSGRRRPSRPSRTTRNPSKYHFWHLHDLIWFSIYPVQKEVYFS